MQLLSSHFPSSVLPNDFSGFIQAAIDDVEYRMMPGTHDPGAAEYAFGERRAVVRTSRTHCMEAVVHARQQDSRLAD